MEFPTFPGREKQFKPPKVFIPVNHIFGATQTQPGQHIAVIPRDSVWLMTSVAAIVCIIGFLSLVIGYENAAHPHAHHRHKPRVHHRVQESFLLDDELTASNWGHMLDSWYVYCIISSY